MTSLAGRPLHEYQPVRELLEALHDVIRGYRSLVEDSRILYRDISINNIVIINAITKGDLKGILINLDLVKELDSLPSRARYQTNII